MKKYVLIGIVALLIVAVIGGVILVRHSTGIPTGEVTLYSQGDSVTLSGDEALCIRTLLTFRFYRYGIGGCPFKDGVTLTIGDREFALATDGCESAKDLRNENCVEFNRVEWDKIKELYTKYFGNTLLD